MATCEELQIKNQDLVRKANSIVQEVSSIRGSAPGSSIEQLQTFYRTTESLRNTLDDVSTDFLALNKEASDNGCREVAEKASRSLGLLQFGLTQDLFQLNNSLLKTINDKKKEAQATQQATTSKDNAGTGTPGTAGQGPTADDLQEVTTTGKKAPAAVTPTGGAPTTGDGLEEVTPTGKRAPQTVDQTEGLEEVSVTGKIATPPNSNTNRGLNGQKQDARAQATLQDTTNFEQMQDWRVRLCLSPGADYLYKAPEGQRGILEPLAGSNGVVFPYTPNITVNYMANYDQINPTHSNYKIIQYTNSAVDSVTISCDFTAQDTREANYLLAVIHFFRSVTKMFYGQDQNPKPGTPPPLVYLFGLGQFQFNAHPLVVTNFTYSLPSDVDYIRAGAVTANPGVNREPSKPAATSSSSSGTLGRLGSIVSQIGSNFLSSVLPGAEPGAAQFTPSGYSAQIPAGTIEPTYVPTKINLQINCTPVVSRNDISNRFSLKDYASGNLLLGTKNKGGGFW
jgi:hypothetical protein